MGLPVRLGVGGCGYASVCVCVAFYRPVNTNCVAYEYERHIRHDALNFFLLYFNVVNGFRVRILRIDGYMPVQRSWILQMESFSKTNEKK